MGASEEPGMEEGATIEIECAVVELRANDILYTTAKAMAQELAHAQEFVDLVHDIHMRRGRKLRLLVDIRQCRSLSREARHLYQSEDHAGSVIGCALMVDSGVSRVIGNFVIALSQSSAPTRLFTREDEALAWLASLS